MAKKSSTGGVTSMSSRTEFAERRRRTVVLADELDAGRAGERQRDVDVERRRLALVLDIQQRKVRQVEEGPDA